MNADKRLTVNLTADQMDVIKRAVQYADYDSTSEWVKNVIREYLTYHGYPFPPDDNAWGRTEAPRTKDGKFASSQNK